MTTHMSDLIDASRKAWDAAPTPIRHTTLALAQRLVDDAGRPDSTALGIVNGLAVADVDPILRNLGVLGLVALDQGWTAE